MRTARLIRMLAAACAAALAVWAQGPVVLVVTAGAQDYVYDAGGTLAGMIERGAQAYVVRVTNDEKGGRGLSPEEAAVRISRESEEAARILGVKEVIKLGNRQGELHDVSFTSMRDRLILLIRHYRPAVLFLPNPYTEYDRQLDRYYAGSAAEDAWHSAALENYLPAGTDAGLRPHTTGEVYYYAPPVDPRRREPESTATFVPQPKTVDIESAFEKKLTALKAFETINRALAGRIRERLDSTGRRLPLLEALDAPSIARLIEENARGLAAIAAEGTDYRLAEQFHYAGLEFRIPRAYREAR